MKIKWNHVALILTGLAAASIGFLIKRNHLESGYVSLGKTEVQLKITVRGTGGRAVKNARISVYDPDFMVIGQTDNNGLLEARALLKSGRSVILQADGIAFKMRRDLLVPRSNLYQASVFFDLAEVHGGNATLISTADTESTSLIEKTAEESEVITIKFNDLKIDNQEKSELEKNIKAFQKSNLDRSKMVLTCSTLQENPALHECTREIESKSAYTFLISQLPQQEKETHDWLTSIISKELTSPSNSLLPNEPLFVVRNKNQKIRAYLDNEPLIEWKSKPNSIFFRTLTDPGKIREKKTELTVITEGGQILQKKIFLPAKRRFVITRLPDSSVLKLSQRGVKQ